MGLVANAAVDNHQQKTDKQHRKIEFTRVLVKGIGRLIDGQSHMADKLGLTQCAFFPNSPSWSERTSGESVTRGLFNSEWGSTEELEHIFTDLLLNQEALFNALDSVVMTTLNDIQEQPRKNDSSNQTGSDVENQMLQRINALKENQQLRYEKLIASGFIQQFVISPIKTQKNNSKNVNSVKHNTVHALHPSLNNESKQEKISQQSNQAKKKEKISQQSNQVKKKEKISQQPNQAKKTKKSVPAETCDDVKQIKHAKHTASDQKKHDSPSGHDARRRVIMWHDGKVDEI